MKVFSRLNPFAGRVPAASWVALGALAAALAALPAAAQYAGGIAPFDAMDTLNSGPVGPGGVGNIALDRAQNLPTTGDPNLYGGTAMVPPGGVMGGYQDPMGGMGQYPNQFGQMVAPVIPKAKVLTGTRVRDAITGELLDDPVIKYVPEPEKEDYYDDGSHGDVEAGDDVFSRVDFRLDDVLSNSSQRAKEQLVRALVEAENLNPIEFYGFSLMTTEPKTGDTSRRRAWKLVPAPGGGPGKVLAEQPVDRPVTVPSYREWRSQKDEKVKDDWAERFLDVYRRDPSSLTSEFLPIYIPRPPQPPNVAPPLQWRPFSDPGSLNRGMSGQGGPGAIPGGEFGLGAMGGGVTGMPQGGASSRYF